MTRKRFSETPTDPMFDMPRQATKRSGGESSKRQRPIGWAKCPECVSHTRIAVMLSGSHVVYREHAYPTWSGARMECRASGVPLCQLAPRPWPSAPEGAVWGCGHA